MSAPGGLGRRRFAARALRCAAAATALVVACSLATAFTARLDVRVEDQTLTGTLDCTPGGAVSGEFSLDVLATDQSGPQLPAGGRAAGRYRLTVRLNGAGDANAADAFGGVAELSGSFTAAAGDVSHLSGSGTFAGSGSVALGTVSLETKWAQLRCDGGGLADPQEFVLRLPPFTVDQPGAAPLADPVAATPPAPPLPAPAPAGALPPVPPDTPVAAGGLLDVPLLKVVLGERLEADRRGVQASAALSGGCPLVYLYLHARETPPQAVVHVALYHQGKLKQRSLVAAQGGDEFVITFYATDAETFPPGQWAVVLRAGERTLGLVPFTVGP